MNLLHQSSVDHFRAATPPLGNLLAHRWFGHGRGAEGKRAEEAVARLAPQSPVHGVRKLQCVSGRQLVQVLLLE